jgi:hypothetical protein
MRKDEIMLDANSRKIHVKHDDTAVISCPHCSLQKVVPVGSYKGNKTRIEIKCECKNVFTVNLEFRKNVRKKTNLSGKFTNHSQQNIRGDIVVKDLSMSGLKFVSMDIDKFMKGDELTVLFKLDIADRATIKKEVIVRDIHENAVGCEFEKFIQFAPEGMLGFYLMS